MALFTRIALRPAPLGLMLGGGLLTAHSILQPRRQNLLLCDSLPGRNALNQYESNAKAPITQDGGKINPRIFSQLSKGSILGLLGGVAVSVFSKPLAFFIGVLILGAQALESRGIHVIPYKRIQGYFTNVDVKSQLQDNVAFKVSLGTTFLLAAFAEF